MVAFAAYAPAIIARGICSGSGRFRAYAIVMGSDGVVRIILCVALAVIGIKTAGAYGFAVALAPLVGLGFVWSRGSLRTDDGPEAPWNEVTPNLGWLLLGSVFAATLLNAGPIATTILAEPGPEDRGHGSSPTACCWPASRCSCSRPCRPPCSPGSAGWRPAASSASSAPGCKRLLIVVLVVGVVGTVGALVLGPFVIKIVYDADLTGRTLAMLALGSACYMVAISLAQAVIALHGHAYVAIGWSIGVVVFVLGTWLSSDDLFQRVEFGLLTSSVAAMVTFAIVLRQRLRHGIEPDAGSMMEAITDMPLET